MARTWLAVDQEREQALWAAGSFPEDLDADGVPDAARVAIKELPLSRLREWKDLALFEKEARVLGELDHPDIPRHVESFLEQEEGGSTFYLIEEWIDGVSLKQSLDQGEVFSEARARELLWQIAPILHYLHDRAPPVVHRDIKPSNLIVRRDGRVALIDFGAVREVKGGDESGPLSTVVGTFRAIARPRAAHERHVLVGRDGVPAAVPTRSERDARQGEALRGGFSGALQGERGLRGALGRDAGARPRRAAARRAGAAAGLG
jgi:serine/threonine protein kinase